MNPLDGTPLWTPETAPDGMPDGGIPMLETILPLGLPRPIALGPVEIASINDTCGNFSGWEAFSVDELRRRYGAVRTTCSKRAGRRRGLSHPAICSRKMRRLQSKTSKRSSQRISTSRLLKKRPDKLLVFVVVA